MLDKIHTVLLKFSSYGIALLAMFFLTYSLGVEGFGRYSILMSVSEFLILLFSGGQGVACIQRALNDNQIFMLSELVVPPLYGFFPAVFILFLSNVAFNLNLDGFALVGLFFYALLYALIIINCSILTGLGSAIMLNNESTVRSLLLILSCTIAYLIDYGLSFSIVISVLVLANVCIFIFSICLLRRFQAVSFGFARYKFDWDSLIHSLMGYFSKKADTLIVGLFFSASVVTLFKYSFLICEAPIQFVVAYLNTMQRRLSTYDCGGVKTTSQIIAVVLSLGGFILAIGYYLLRSDELSFLYIYLAIAPYFLVKSILYYFEYKLIISVSTNKLRTFSIFQACGHIFILYCLFAFIDSSLLFIFGLSYFALLVFENFCLFFVVRRWNIR